MKSTLRNICARELDRLEAASVRGPLEIDDLKRIEILTRSLKQLEETPKPPENLDELTVEDLLRLARMENADASQENAAAEDSGSGAETEPRQEVEGVVKTGRRKKGHGRVVEEGGDT